MAVYKIPLQQGAQEFWVALPNGSFRFRLIYAVAPGGGWLLDVADANENWLVRGIPLVTGADLLAQHRHLGILDAPLYVATDADISAPPTFDSLGVTSHLYFEA